MPRDMMSFTKKDIGLPGRSSGTSSLEQQTPHLSQSQLLHSLRQLIWCTRHQGSYVLADVLQETHDMLMEGR